MAALMHWSVQRDDAGIAWVKIHRADAPINSLSCAVLDEFDCLLDALDAAPPAALVIESAKPAGFIAGADLTELRALESSEAARALLERGWRIFNRLADLPYPTLALIHGHCLGGGLELSLACRYRIAIDAPATRLGLPEVMVGLVPAWGGMLRLPRLIGALPALDMMLSGRSLDARRARACGLVDACVPARVKDNAARQLLAAAPAPHRASLPQRVLGGPLKLLTAAFARRALAKRARPAHYPAPYAVLTVWSRFAGNLLAVPPDHPASLARLIAHPTTKNLLRVFFLQERLKSQGHDSGPRMARVHVIGAGTMGGDIAAWCALQGMTVSLQDQNVERIAPAMARAASLYARRFSRDTRQVRAALDRLIPDPSGHGIAQADVIIEAIFENLDAKRALFRKLEAHAKPEALLATNTSSLKLEDIACVLQNPARLVGIHFFNPVAKMPLVEVVQGAQSDATACARALAFVRAIDKLPLPVKSAPGFLVNAVLAPYLDQALRCVDEGLAPETIDAAARAFGMPMGPIELADTIGLDIALAAGRALLPDAEPPRHLAARVAEGHLGKKTGRGFYVWAGERAQKKSAPRPSPDLAERLIAPLIEAARRCVEEGVVTDAELADAGVIFGTGFAPYTGGPLLFRAQHCAPT